MNTEAIDVEARLVEPPRNGRTEVQIEGRGRAIRFLQALKYAVQHSPAPDHVGNALDERQRRRRRAGSIDVDSDVVEIDGKRLLNR